MADYGYTVVYDQLSDGGYQVIVPAIPEICTFGRTLDEARAMAQDSIRCFLESALATGEPVPQDVQTATERASTSATSPAAMPGCSTRHGQSSG